MKDTDNVLIALDRIGAEDKCLMLIRKPKSASKQMLKAHSWANLSFPEPHLQCLDGTFKGDTLRHQKHKINEQLVIGTHLKILEGLLKPCQEELLLTFARDKARKFIPPQGVPSPNEDVKKLEEKISRMELELRKKERTLKQLNALLPWTLSSDGKPADLNEVNDSYISSLSEDEYIV